ncbi:MAG TPA: hypothetical protein VM513_30735 [Kofleriaceae bacterium]|nr:hypothetical protein [Kofleriaceae bacterium]
MTRGLLALTLFAAACSDASSSPRPPIARGASSTVPTAELLRTMSTLAGEAAAPARIDEWARKIDAGEATISAYIDELLTSERFANDVIPMLVFGAYGNIRNYYALPSAFTLSRAADGSGPYYLRAPCTRAEAVDVRPWWDLSSTVTVCPDAYRPERWSVKADEQAYKTAAVLACDSQIGSPELETQPLCGCGPNLIRCLRDTAHYEDLNRSLMNEVKRTTAYVVQHDLPMQQLFTSNATFRDRNAELYYRRQKIGAREVANPEKLLETLGSWPQEGQWAPREELVPGQHAGLLTAPQILHWSPDRRQRQREYYEVLWCSLRNNFGATTHQVLEINKTGNNLLVADSWQKLAHTELCSACHARLDYGFQFFLGYPDSRTSTHFQPSLQSTAKGPLYGRDIDDPRGDAPLNPLAFATLATAQPDFQRCMTDHFVDYVLGDRATADDVRAIETAVAETKTFKAAMKVALERWALTWRTQTHVAAPVEAASPMPAAPPAETVKVSPALRAQLDQHCADCHDEVPYTDQADAPYAPFTFAPPELPRRLVVRMAEQVSFGMMPQGQSFASPREREELVDLLLQALWPADPAARAEAARYYLGGARGLPAHQIDNAVHAIDLAAGRRPDVTWGALERAIWTDQSTITPGFVTLTALEALRACAGAGDKLDACLDKTLSVETLSRVPVPAGR